MSARRFATALIGAVIGMGLAAPRQAHADTFLVNRADDDASATQCFTDLPDLNCSLRGAIARANTNGGSNSIDFDGSVFGTAQTITLTNGSLPGVTVTLAIHGPGAELLTIDGNSTSRIFYADTGTTFTLDGVTIAHGSTSNGAGLYSNGASVAISNSTFAGNVATNRGGAIYVNGGSVTMSSSTLSANSAINSHGGGIYNLGALTVTDTHFSGNSASGTESGGGLFNGLGGVADVSLSSFFDNTAGSGGGVAVYNGTVNLTDCIFSNNTVIQQIYGGGAVYLQNSASVLSIVDSAFTGNTSTASPGGGLHLISGTARVSGSTFSGNSSTDGGAIYLQTGVTLTVVNSTFSGNSATNRAGALDSQGGAVTITNSTFSGNSSSASSGLRFATGTAILNNSIVAGNTGSSQCTNIGTVNAHNTLMEDGTCGVTNGVNGNLTGDPLLGALADNGGTTQTMLLLAGSPAIDACDAALAVDADDNPLTVDQRGIGRTQGAACDMGAVEVRQARLTATVGSNGSVSAVSDPSLIGGTLTNCSNAVCSNDYEVEGSVPIITLSEVPDIGYHFVGWTDVCIDFGTASSVAVSLGSDRSCGATFEIDTHLVGGTVSGLSGSGLVLQNNAGDDLAISANGSFSFVTPLDFGAAYAVTISAQPSNPTQTCTLTNASGTVGDGDVTSIVVTCTTNAYSVGGTVSGLTGTGLVLRNNGGDDLPINASGPFAFPTMVASGSPYAVSVSTQPNGQICTVSGGNGSVTNADISDVLVDCTASPASVSVTIDDGTAYAQVGKVLDYTITVSNSGGSAASDVAITSVESPALDVGSLVWTCVDATNGATCTGSGSGGFSDTATLPASSSVTYALSVSVVSSTSEAAVTLSVDATGASTAEDVDTLVLFRDEFELPPMTGVPKAIVGDAAIAVLQGNKNAFTVLPPSTVDGIGTLLTVSADDRGLDLQRMSLHDRSFVRLLARDADGSEHASVWSAAHIGTTLTLGTLAGREHDRVGLLDGAEQPAVLVLPSN